jgi:putative Mg2+ transporter-C (MgtC) family protein
MPFDLGDLFPHLASLCGAYALALPIGWDRERNERSAGLRTFPLVALASCGFVQATELHIQGSPEAQARIFEGLITGIGLIGGGAIIKQGGAGRCRARQRRPASGRSAPRSASAATTSPS